MDDSTSLLLCSFHKQFHICPGGQKDWHLSFVLKSFTSFSVGAGGAYCIFLDGDLLLTKGKGDSRVHRRLITYGVSIGQESFGLRGGRMDTSADEEGVYILWNRFVHTYDMRSIIVHCMH
jgi:hypothetical protein